MQKQSQQLRVLFLLLNLGFLLLVSYIAFGSLIPPSPKSLWLFTGLVAALVGNLLVSPFFIRPADSIPYALACWIGVATVPLAQQSQLNVLSRYCMVIYCITVLLAALISILFKDTSRESLKELSNILRKILQKVGDPTVMYGITVIYAVFNYHTNSAKEVFLILSASLIILTIRPFEQVVLSIRHALTWNRKPEEECKPIGSITAFQTPSIALIRQRGDQFIRSGEGLVLNDPNGGIRLAISVGYIGQDQGKLLRVIEIDTPPPVAKEVSELAAQIPEMNAGLVKSEFLAKVAGNVEILNKLDKLVGIVDVGSSLDRIYFEVIRDTDLEVGKLVETKVGTQTVLFQIVDGVTREEVLQQKNQYGYARAQAMKVGVWDNVQRKFIHSKWIPKLNEPVFLDEGKEIELTETVVGTFPGTSYPAEVSNIHELVTHNTAILGILGVGKSYLAIELVERMFREEVKVICLDLTNQYRELLDQFYDVETEEPKLHAIREAGDKDRQNCAENPSEGGSLPNLNLAIYNDLESFIQGKSELKIYNPAEITATKQKSDPKPFKKGGEWVRGASLWEITPVEVTRIVAENCLKLLQSEMSEKARVCIVLEEAHSLVPEWNSVVDEGDKNATAGTARAILQGRKYGLGCLLITQRTANVTKTILNQCNSIFAMRTYDDTGKGFLSNYIGSYYSDILSNIESRSAVFFGKASKCENPVLVRLNDRDEFLKRFRGG